MPATFLSRVGTVIAKLFLSGILFVFGAGVAKQIAMAFGSTYVSSSLALVMMVSLILPVWFRAPLPWKIAAGAAAFMAGISVYIAGRLPVLLFHAGVNTSIEFASTAARVLAGCSVIVSLLVVILVLRLGRKRSARHTSP